SAASAALSVTAGGPAADGILAPSAMKILGVSPTSPLGADFLEAIMLFYPSEKLALFIDGANLYGAAKGLQFDIDYKRLLELFARKGNLVRAFYYTAVAEDQEFSPLRPLVDWLDYNGFAVVTKPLKEFTDAQGRRRVK